MNAQARRGGGARAESRRAPSPLVAFAALLAAGTLAACSPAAGGTQGGKTADKGPAAPTSTFRSKPKPPPPRPTEFGVGVRTVTWDESKGFTPNYYLQITTPGRILKVQILYPTLHASATASLPAHVPSSYPAYRYGPYPVIVFAHGYGVDPNTYRALLVSWATAGYVVLAPFFPDTSAEGIEAQHGVDTELDMFNQPADVAFVVSQVRDAGRGKASPSASFLVGLVDSGEVILAGQSDGADTVAALVYDHAYSSSFASMGTRPSAVALLSGAEWTRDGDVYSARPGGGPPALVVQSLTDACNYPSDSSQLYNMMRGKKWFLALDDATHLGPYVGIGAAAVTVKKVTLAFFDLALGRSGATPESLFRDGNHAGTSSITEAPKVPLYPDPPMTPDPCAPPSGAAAS